MPAPEPLGFSLTTPTENIPVIPIQAVTDQDQAALLANQQQWLQISGFQANPGRWCLLPPADQPSLLLIVDDDQDWRSWADLARALPPGYYRLANTDSVSLKTVIRGWASGHYRFHITQKIASTANPERPLLCLPTATSARDLLLADAEYHVRYLIDSPANIMTTNALAAYAQELFTSGTDYPKPQHVQHIVGEELLARNFPLIHSVGQASIHPPQLLDMQWTTTGQESAPLITIIGKGVCFDSGGLDIKPREAMLNMKKDMGGAAHAIGTVALLLCTGIRARLRLILGIAENAISDRAFRPGDILTARSGKTIEIGDTDAEGRLVLADCLTLAAEGKPDLVVDFATLTGAARVALGTDLPALFCNDDALATQLTQHDHDPLWQMPLHVPYQNQMDGRISDLNSAPGSGLAGAINAALFLQHFVPEGCAWAHIDLMAYAPKPTRGRATGGAAQGIYATSQSITNLFGGLETDI